MFKFSCERNPPTNLARTYRPFEHRKGRPDPLTGRRISGRRSGPGVAKLLDGECRYEKAYCKAGNQSYVARCCFSECERSARNAKGQPREAEGIFVYPP